MRGFAIARRGHGVLLLVLLFALTVGFCGFGHWMSSSEGVDGAVAPALCLAMAGDDLAPTICFAMIATAVAVILLVRPLPSGSAESYRLGSLLAPLIHVLLPPPKTALLA